MSPPSRRVRAYSPSIDGSTFRTPERSIYPGLTSLHLKVGMPPDLGSGPNLITPYEISLDGPRIPDIDVHNQPDGGAKGALARTLLCRSSPSPRSAANRSEEQTPEPQSPMRITYAVS